MSDIAAANGLLWSSMLDEPLLNIGAASALIAWATQAHGLPLPPLRTVGEAWETCRAMFSRVDEPASEVVDRPLAWSATG